MSLPNKKTSIVLEHYEPTKLNSFDINKAKWDYFFQIKTLVYAELEKIRINKEINKNNQALVEITFNNQYQFNEKDLARYLNVAQVKIQLITSNEIKVRVSNANLVRCERCWNYFEPSQMAEEQLCKRCDNVLKNRATNK
jgi:isoleucyl-tRNA synthetase